jgi:hypothetical protein
MMRSLKTCVPIEPLSSQTEVIVIGGQRNGSNPAHGEA